MSYNTVFAQGTATVTIPANESIAVQAFDTTFVNQLIGFPSFPPNAKLLGTILNGTSVFGPFTTGAVIQIQAGAAGAVYAVGTAPVISHNGNWQPQGAPANIADGGSMVATAANVLNGIITATPTAGRNIQLPTGAALDLATEIAIGESFDFNVITLAAFALTLTVNTGVTIVGDPATGAGSGSPAQFRLRKTAADTFVVYRIG